MAKKSTLRKAAPAAKKGKLVKKPPKKVGVREYEQLKKELEADAGWKEFLRSSPRLTPTERTWCVSALAASLMWARDNGFRFEWQQSLKGKWDCLIYSRGDRYLGSATYIGYDPPADPSRDGDLVCEAATAMEAIAAIGLRDDIFGFNPKLVEGGL